MPKKSKRSFTLIETIIVIIVISIIGGMGVYAMARFYELWMFSNYKMEVLWSAHNLTQDLTKNIRMVRDKNSVYIATATRFQFYNLGTGANTDYQYSNNKVYKNGVQITPSEVASFAFTYYNCNSSGTCVAPSGLTNINTLKLDFTLTNPRQSVSTESTVHLRNFQ
jgi:Tfp pilus assembly protein PilV